MLWPSIGPLEIVRRCQNCIVIFAWIWRGGGQKSLTRKIPKSKDQESLDLQNLYESGLTFYQNEWRGLSSEYLSACTEKCIFQYFQASQLNPHRGGAIGPSMKISCRGTPCRGTPCSSAGERARPQVWHINQDAILDRHSMVMVPGL